MEVRGYTYINLYPHVRNIIQEGGRAKTNLNRFYTSSTIGKYQIFHTVTKTGQICYEIER